MHDAVVLAALLAIGIILWWIGYQGVFSTYIPVGGNAATHKREYDAPFLHGVNASEPENPDNYRWWTLPPGYAYRWTKQETTLHVAGVGGGHWLVSIHALSGRPASEPTQTTWHTAKRQLPTFTMAATPRTYHILAEATTAGDLHLTMHTPAYPALDDPRELGFVLRGVRIAAVDSGTRLPAIEQLGWLTIIMLLVYGISRWLTLPIRMATLLVLVLELTTAILLGTHRFTLTLFTPILAGVLLAGIPLALLLTAITKQMLRWQCWQYAAHKLTSTRPIVALVLLAFVLRLGGMLHPYAIFSDHRLHANNLLDVIGMGTVYFTEGLPAEAGGGKSPYPPGVYLVAAPAQFIAPDTMIGRVLVIQSSVALLDSLVLLGLWLVLRQAGMGNRTALWGAALYLAPIPMMVSFSIGEYANIGGQALAMVPLVLLASGMLPSHTIGFAALLAMGLLVHMGVTLSLVLVLAAWGMGEVGVLLYARARGMKPIAQQRQSVSVSFKRLTGFIGASVAAGGFAALVYYAASPFRYIYADRLADTTQNTTQNEPVAEILGDIARNLFHPSSQLVPVLVACGLVGGVLLWYRHHRLCSSQAQAGQPAVSPRTLGSMVHMIGAWWLGTLLSFGLLLIAQRGVRWQHFLYPVLCLSAAPLLAAYAKRGRVGVVVAWVGVVVPVGYGVVAWVEHLRWYLH